MLHTRHSDRLPGNGEARKDLTPRSTTYNDTYEAYLYDESVVATAA